MFRSSVRSYTLPVIVTVVLLRLVIGFHFYHEGRTKQASGSFTSSGFLSNAKGPLAPFFHSLVADRTWTERFGYIEPTDQQPGKPPFDMERTLTRWAQFRDQAIAHYRLGSEGELGSIKQALDRAETDLAAARQAGDAGRASQLEARVRGLQVAVASGGNQVKQAQSLYGAYARQLEDLYAQAEPDLNEYFLNLSRITRMRDQADWQELSDRRGQVDYAERKSQAKVRRWVKEIDTMWDGYEREMQAVASSVQRERYGDITMRRPGDQGLVSASTVDAIIPWFDTILGLLIFFGLFTRIAATLAGLFLVTVCLSQWPGSPGAVDVSYQAIEAAACFLLAAIGAGRFAGLDFFLRAGWYSVFPPPLEPSVPADAYRR